MNLNKAQQIIQLNISEAGTKMPPDVRTALIIHSEAITRLEALRVLGYPKAIIPLPSESIG